LAEKMLERFRLDGEVAVIMGGGNGIGRATAAALVEAGAAVALFDRDEKALKRPKPPFVPPVQKLKRMFSTSRWKSVTVILLLIIRSLLPRSQNQNAKTGWKNRP
jgi:hypothetical protein